MVFDDGAEVTWRRQSAKFSNVAVECWYCGLDLLAVPPLVIALTCLACASAASVPGSSVCPSSGMLAKKNLVIDCENYLKKNQQVSDLSMALTNFLLDDDGG